jgi:hypothetical protein
LSDTEIPDIWLDAERLPRFQPVEPRFSVFLGKWALKAGPRGLDVIGSGGRRQPGSEYK